ncbi:MAG TPA: AAA family ATPase [Thermomicrobiales bacterium]|jgi:ATP-dependent Clp protease ATP-binding subunit ClpC|nr:AAA family ATPase [Thermomicrobiales bacterium]
MTDDPGTPGSGDDGTGAEPEISNNDGGRPPRLPRPPRAPDERRPVGRSPRALPPGNGRDDRSTLIRFLNSQGNGDGDRTEREGDDPDAPTSATPLIDASGRDLTAMARAGELAPIIGRDDEILRLAQTLLRHDRPAPLLVGEPGVGRTAIVEGLAIQAVAEGADPRLGRLRIVQLALDQLGGDAVIRPRMANRFSAVLEELVAHPETILFIDGLHLLLGGTPVEIVPSEVLRGFLSHHAGQIVGTTTTKIAEALLSPQREFAPLLVPITVGELSEDDARTLLTRQAERYATHHDVEIPAETIEAALTLAVRYVPQGFLPRKAADLLDIAASQRSLPVMSGRPDGPRPVVLPDAIATALQSRWGITPPAWDPSTPSDAPASTLAAPPDLAQRLATRILGQPEAVGAAADAVRVAALGLRPGDRPRAVMLFGGPTGVGKTALARNLAGSLFGSEDALLRIDMSEFQQQHNVARLLGAPPGFVGYNDGGQLTRFLRAHPESVILLDEIEKAHPQALDIFLQLFDAGRITDGHGQVLDARHAIFIMTTNLPMSADLAGVRARLRPEFLNRIDRIVRFRALELDDLERIVSMRLDELSTQLRQRQIILRVEPDAITALARPEIDGRAANGRTIERRLDQDVAGPVAEWASLLSGMAPGQPVVLTLAPTETGTRVAPPGMVFDRHA